MATTPAADRVGPFTIVAVVVGLIVLAVVGYLLLSPGDGDDDDPFAGAVGAEPADDASGGEPSTDDEPTGPTEDEPGDEPAGDGDAACAAAEEVRRLDDEFGTEMGALTLAVADGAAGADALVELRRSLTEVNDELLAVYGDLEAAAPDSLRDDVRTLADGTNQLTQLLLDDPAGFEQRMRTDREVQEMVIATGRAALAVNEFTVRECDVVIAD